MSNELHVIPRLDDLVHTETPKCVCGPGVKHVECADGSDGWLYIHHSLDGREKTE